MTIKPNEVTRRKIYVVGGDSLYACWMEGVNCDKMDEADLVVFTGGEDVSPELYSAEMHPRTSCNPSRDKKEVDEFNRAFALKKPMVGICRGAQFLCVMAGGELVQHQDNPKFLHRLNTFDERAILVTSTHHQAQYPWKLHENDFRVLGWTIGISPFHEGENREELVNGVSPSNIEVEDCHYPHIRALGIQSHPEMLFLRPGWDKDTEQTIKYYQELLNAFLNDFPNAK